MQKRLVKYTPNQGLLKTQFILTYLNVLIIVKSSKTGPLIVQHFSKIFHIEYTEYTDQAVNYWSAI